MTGQLFMNNASSTLASAISAVDTALTVSTGDGSKFPSPGVGEFFLMTLAVKTAGFESAWEVVKVTARSGDVLTCERGVEGAAIVCGAGTEVGMRVSAGLLDDLYSSGSIPVSGSSATELNVNSVNAYTLLTPDTFTTYAATATRGVTSVVGAAVTYTAPATAGADDLILTAGRIRRVLPFIIVTPPAYIATPTATPGSFGAAFEDGFYTGMIWNQLVQSATSTTVGTGTKAFAVPDMTATPLVYAGQTLEVRSRANPNNRMIGLVTGASGTTLTLNVTSVGGSGTFTDWSVMARYRLIVSPRATGDAFVAGGTTLTIKSTAGTAPAGCATLTEGYNSTMLMVGAGDSTLYPAAWFCKNLTIDGRTDWYLPARDEMELAHRNLKASTIDNATVAADYNRWDLPYSGMVDGSFGDTGIEHGINLNSSPPDAVGYTAGVPVQVADALGFRNTETEYLGNATATTTTEYWTSTLRNTSAFMTQGVSSSHWGYQGANSHTGSKHVRAFRRSII